MKKQTAILLSAGMLVGAGNLYLALKEDSKAMRSSYIADWAEIGKQTLTETLHAEGVVTPETEHPVYYDPKTTEFKGFLVKEGDEVQAGTPLFDYSSAAIDDELARLEAETDKLETEARLLEEQIQQLAYLQSVSDATTDDSLPVAGDGITADPTNDLLAVSIEKEMYDKQLEKSRVEAEIDQYKQQLAAYDSSGKLEASSEVAGSVKDIHYDLNNPIMTIISATPKVEGMFSEKDLNKVEEGMDAYVKADLLKGAIGGTVTKIATHPESDPAVNKESQFPFEIQLELKDDTIVHGTHVDVSVVTNEVVNAAVVPQTAISKGKIYLLNENGKVEPRSITKGLAVGGMTEVKQGAKPGELFVREPEDVQQANSPFFSKLKLSSLRKNTFEEAGNRQLFKQILVGFFK